MKRILIVEDDTTMLKLLADVLSKQFQIYEACKVKEALHNLEENTVDLISSDYNLPDGTGLELLEQLCRNGKSIPFLRMAYLEFPDETLYIQIFIGELWIEQDIA